MEDEELEKEDPVKPDSADPDGPLMKMYVDDIQMQLGYPVVQLELDRSQIRNIVNRAFSELKHYVTDSKLITIPYQNKIDVKDYKIDSILYIMRGQPSTKLTPLQDVMFFYSDKGAYSNYNLTDYARAMLSNSNKNAISTDLDFKYDKDERILYVNCNQAIPQTITIEYIPEYDSVEELKESYWQNILKKFSLAMTKVILGRIRGKYTLNSATYNLDADQLLSEGNSELQEIRSFLDSNNDSLFVID